MRLLKKIESSKSTQLLILSLIGFFYYWPSLLGGPTFIDDDGFIFEFIPLIKSQSPLIFWDYSGEYGRSWPLSYTVFWAIYKLVQDSYWVYKLINLSLHIFNSYLIISLFKKVFSQKIAIGAAIVYLIHPIQIETVSWIFQLNTILATSFFLLSYKAFLGFLDKKNVFLYASAIYLFLFSLLSKVSAIMLPILFLYHALRKYHSKKIYALILTAPFLTLSLYKGLEGTDALEGLDIDTRLSIDKKVDVSSPPSSVPTLASPPTKETIKKDPIVATPTKKVISQKASEKETLRESVQAEKTITPVIKETKKEKHNGSLKKIKILYASFSYYLSHFLIPVELSIIMPDVTELNILNILSWLFTACLIIFLLFKRKKIEKKSHLLILFLILSVIPIIGFIFIPFMNLSLVADHWFYLGMIPTSVLFIRAITELKNKHQTFALSLFLIIWSYQSLTYVHLFNDKFKLIEKAIKILPSDFSLRMELATALLEEDRLKDAQYVIEEALSKPIFKDNMFLLMQGGYIDRQLGDKEKLAQKIYQIGMIYIKRGDFEKAERMLNQLREITNKPNLIQSLESFLKKEN